MNPVRIPAYSDRQNRALQRIVELMASAESRAEARYKTQRRHDRLDFQGVILVCQPTPAFPVPAEDHPTAMPAWAYNLSASGVGFVSRQTIAETCVAIGLKRPDGSLRWISGRIVRSRPIPQEEFLDYGVEFESRSDNRDSTSGENR